MNKEDLQKFCCGPDDIRYHLQKPWSDGEWTYATNGYICVRVPRLADVEDDTGAPRALKLFAETPTNGKWFPVPYQAMPDDIPCDVCNGEGKFSLTDDDPMEDCEYCDGTGKKHDITGRDIGNANFQCRFLAMIQGWEIAPNGKSSAARIRNGDAEGLLMPIRKE